MQVQFLRFGISSPLRIDGRPIVFEDIGNDTGLLTLADTPDNAPWIRRLREYASRQIGGVKEATPEEVEAEKKTASEEQKRSDEREASLRAHQFNPAPKVAAGGDPLQGAPDRLSNRKVFSNEAPTPDVPPAVPLVPVPDGSIETPAGVFPKPYTNAEYAREHGGAAADKPAPSKPAADTKPTTAKASTVG